jgi:hypothetical protein
MRLATVLVQRLLEAGQPNEPEGRTGTTSWSSPMPVRNVGRPLSPSHPCFAGFPRLHSFRLLGIRTPLGDSKDWRKGKNAVLVEHSLFVQGNLAMTTDRFMTRRHFVGHTAAAIPLLAERSSAQDQEAPSRAEPGEAHEYTIEISSSYYPYYLRNLNTGEDNIALAREPVIAGQTVFHDSRRPSHVVLPMIPAEE